MLKVTREFSEPDEENPEYEILYLFFKERREHFLLLGREEVEEEGSESESDEDDLESDGIYESEDGQGEEYDDDSPYFVKITIDEQFLGHLKEPNLHYGREMDNEDAIDIMKANEVFKEIVRRELDMMFGTSKDK